MLEFEKEFNVCKNLSESNRWDCEIKVRRKYKEYLSGRYYDMAEKIHRFIALCDKQHLEKHKNQTLKDIAMEYGVIEEMSKDF